MKPGEPTGDDEFYSSPDPSDYLLKRGNFERCVVKEYESIAFDHCSTVAVGSDKHDLQIAYERYCSLYGAFRQSLNGARKARKPKGGLSRPNQFKIAAALCFSLRRARPISRIEPSYDFARRIAEGAVDGMIDADAGYARELTPQFQHFYQFADEICAFEIGLRVALHLTAQDKVARLELSQDKLAWVMERCRPRIKPEAMLDILVTLRDHATSPYSLLVLYAACFAERTQ